MPELVERIDTINRQLREQYGFDSNTNRPIFRVVWSEDQFEKRKSDYSPEGFVLLTPQVFEFPKYRQWIPEKYILERLVVVPDMNKDELGQLKLSYEPIWIFETQRGEYLPPKFEVAKIVCDTLYAALGKKSMRKYVDEEAKNPIEHREARIKKLQAELFGEDTVGPLEHGGGVYVKANPDMVVNNPTPEVKE